MRLKQLLVVLLLLVSIASVAAMAADMPQLMNVSVVGEGTRSTVTVRASGAFVHNEYRPTENLLLVDLAGVSAGKLHLRERAVQVPGLKSYRVVGYTGAGGTQITRLELVLEARPEVHISENKDGLTVDIAPTGVAATPLGAQTEAAVNPAPSMQTGTGAAAVPSTPANPLAEATPRNVDVTVMRTGEDVAVEVTGNGTLNAKMMKLDHPDRVVLDVVNAVPANRPRRIVVNSGEIRTVRMARFQDNPPITRVVLDLAAPRAFELVQGGDKLTLKPRSVDSASDAAAPTPAAETAVAAIQPVVPAAEPQPAVSAVVKKPEIKLAKASTNADDKSSATPNAQDFVVIQPKIEQHLGSTPDPQPAAQPASEPKLMAAAGNAAGGAAGMAAPLTAPAPASQTPAAPTTPVAPPAPPAAAVAPQPPVNFAAEQRQQSEHPAPAAAKRYTGEPISVNLKDVDLKDFFRLIHEISGLNIVLDPSVKGSLTLVLDDVPWDQALDIVLKNNGLDRQLEGNVLRVATVESLRKEAEARRKQLEAQALAVDKVTVTRFLSYAHAKDVMPTIKKQLSSRGDIVADVRTNALIISDIPSVIPPIDRLLTQLDRKTQEVEIEARVVAATRSFARDIGTQLAFGWGNNPSAVGGALGASPLFDGNTSPLLLNAGKAGTIPLFTNLAATAPTSGLSFLNVGSNYRLDAILTMAESRGLLKILSRPRVITQNNIQAVVKQGQRVPITTLGQLGGPPTVAYIEAVLRLTVTPQITAENTIFLNVDIENTTPDFSHTVQGNPVFLTQQTTTQVLVTNGGTVVIGGVLQSNNALTINQVPLLGSVPGLGNLFKRRSVNVSTQELIFFLTPKIVET